VSTYELAASRKDINLEMEESLHVELTLPISRLTITGKNFTLVSKADLTYRDRRICSHISLAIPITHLPF